MDATPLSSALKRMSMEDILMAMKDLQLKNQALQEENRRLITAPSIPNTTSSPVLLPDNSAAADAGGSAQDSASNTKTQSLFDDKESQKELDYCAMKMVVFGHIWFERKGLFGIGLDSAHHQLDAATLTNAIDTGIERPSPDQIVVLWLVLRLYEFLPSVFHPLANATVTDEGGWKPPTVELPQPVQNSRHLTFLMALFRMNVLKRASTATRIQNVGAFWDSSQMECMTDILLVCLLAISSRGQPSLGLSMELGFVLLIDL
ncbi:hypothetical protein EDD18DRAFT_1103308 [Armillaria luteobubalina]|uniref:Uncharacterized protein n=1 Tax=Armillaria luteobubalina TaxID=153913 RepID=A0AA39UYZ0_9AGAR|nr:hypothetical protein EDD18DRAFT_1103308 [Armillaria luteobubalina]